jgi:hypothetical protein
MVYSSDCVLKQAATAMHQRHAVSRAKLPALRGTQQTKHAATCKVVTRSWLDMNEHLISPQDIKIRGGGGECGKC